MKKILFIIFLGLLITSCKFDDDGNVGENNNNIPVDPANPAIPHNPNPEDGEKGVNNVVKLSWEAEGVDSFRVLFDDKNPPIEIGRVKVVSQETTLFAKGEGELYYWRVISLLGNGSELAGPVWSFTTEIDQPTPPGYVMIKHSLTTEPPNKVKILFQVLDLDERGVTNLTVDDFELFENADKISVLESNLSITKRLDNNYNLKTVLMLDNSTSIVDDDPTNLPKIKNAATDLVNGMEKQQVISVFKFSSDPDQIIDFTGFNDRFNIISAINTIQRGTRSTNLYGAVIRGAQELTESFSANLIEQSYMILFTDGDDTQDSRSLNDALDAVAGKNVYTVGLGVDLDPEVLDLIGTEGYFQINEAGELSQIFSEIQNDIIQLSNSFYWLEYESPKRGNNEHLLNLFIKDNAINSFIEGTFSSAGFFDAEPGLYFNTSFGDPLGDSEVGLTPGAPGTVVTLQTYGGAANVEPIYSWEQNTYLRYDDISPNGNRSQMKISAIPGAPVGQRFQITVFDVTNNFDNNIDFLILNPPSPIIYFRDATGAPIIENTTSVTFGEPGIFINVGTSGANTTPSYSWQSDSRLTFDFLTPDNSQVRVSAAVFSFDGERVEIEVTDINNNSSEIINFLIFAP